MRTSSTQAVAGADRLKTQDEWTDIPIFKTKALPKLPKSFTFSNARFLARSHHSQVHIVDVTDQGNTFATIVKVFSKELKDRFLDETKAYRYLQHYNVTSQGVVPKFYGSIASLDKKKLLALLPDSAPEDGSIKFPASAIVIEYLEGGEKPSQDNMTRELTEEALRGLRLVHNAHVWHGDPELRNILIFPESGRAVWIDFSNAEVNVELWEVIRERDIVRSRLYRRVVCPAEAAF